MFPSEFSCQGPREGGAVCVCVGACVCVCVCVCQGRGAIGRRKWVDARVWFSSNLRPTLVLRRGVTTQGAVPVVLSFGCRSGDLGIKVQSLSYFLHVEGDPRHPPGCWVGKINSVECLGARAGRRNGGLMDLLSGTCCSTCHPLQKIGHGEKLSGSSCLPSERRNTSEQEGVNSQNGGSWEEAETQRPGFRGCRGEKQPSLHIAIIHLTHR